MPRSKWTCPTCRHLNQRTSSRKCLFCGGLTKPKRRVTKHKQTLRDDNYPAYVQFARDVHGVADESCNACGKPRSQERRHDRDHDHKTGLMRGLLCPGNQGCNVLLLPWISATVAEAIYKAKAAANEPDAGRWLFLAAYLERVERWYQENPE